MRNKENYPYFAKKRVIVKSGHCSTGARTFMWFQWGIEIRIFYASTVFARFGLVRLFFYPRIKSSPGKRNSCWTRSSLSRQTPLKRTFILEAWRSWKNAGRCVSSLKEIVLKNKNKTTRNNGLFVFLLLIDRWQYIVLSVGAVLTEKWHKFFLCLKERIYFRKYIIFAVVVEHVLVLGSEQTVHCRSVGPRSQPRYTDTREPQRRTNYRDLSAHYVRSYTPPSAVVPGRK